MEDKHLRYYYEVEYNGIERITRKPVLRKAVIKSADIAPQDFPFRPLEDSLPITAELVAVADYLNKNLAPDIESIIDYTIERKDEFQEMFDVKRTVPRLITKWSSFQTFTLTTKQEEVFKLIENQLATISLKWGEWKTLYGPPFENLPILQQVAPTSFSIARESLIHDVMLSMRRLFDKEVMCGHETCSFYWLAVNLDEGNKRSEFEDALLAMKPRTEFLTTWRHKVIAHNDYEHGVNKQLLPAVEIDQIDSLIKEMSSLLNIIQMNLSTNNGWRYMIYHDVNSRGGADNLLHYLKRGIKERDAALERMKDQQAKWGQPPDGDTKNPTS